MGALSSGKTALVHRYLTGSYMSEESPEGGRFKKELVIDGASYLLLIRDEGGAPEQQFADWCDAVVFVFRSVIGLSYPTRTQEQRDPGRESMSGGEPLEKMVVFGILAPARVTDLAE